MPRSEEFVSARDLLHRQLVVADPPPGATSFEFQCALFCPSPFCLIWTVLHWRQRPAESERHNPGLWQTPELPSTLLLHSCRAHSFCFCCAGGYNALLLRPSLDRCFPCRTISLLTDFLDCLSRSQSASTKACKQTPNPLLSSYLQILRPAETSAWWRTQCRAGACDKWSQPRCDRTEHGCRLPPQLGVGAVFIVFDPGLSLAATPGVSA